MQITKQLNLKMVSTERASLGVDAAVTFITPRKLPRHADVNRMPELLARLHIHCFSWTAISLFENDMTCVTIIGDDEPLIAFMFAVMAPHASLENKVADIVRIV
jgi:hypothetical protein